MSVTRQQRAVLDHPFTSMKAIYVCVCKWAEMAGFKSIIFFQGVFISMNGRVHINVKGREEGCK